MIDAVIFDLDGLLIDSEPLWQKAEQTVFATLGVTLTPADCALTTGLRIDEVVAYWRRRRPWEGSSDSAVVEGILAHLIELLRTEARPMPGALPALACALRVASGRVGLASSSPKRVIHAALEGIGLQNVFPVVASAEDDPYGKPHPAVYLRAASLLGHSPVQCLAVEDSLTGLIAARAARMTVVAVPEHGHRNVRPEFHLAARILPSLEHFHETLWHELGGARA